MKVPEFPTYETYKDSGVEWLGRIPGHWEVEKGKWLFEKKERPVRPEDGVVTAFRDGQVTLRSNRRTDGFTNAIKEHGYQGIRKGDLVIHAMDAFAGAIGVSESDGKSTPVYAACVPRDSQQVNPSFYAYLLRYMAHSGFILTLAKGIRERSTDFRFNDFGGLQYPLPPKPEQDRIVAFLDEKTSMIDELIAKKKRQIELLEEQKAILINRAVTRGLNPDVKLKASGIDWIGDIPEGWCLTRLKYVTARVGDGLHGTPVYDDSSDIFFINGNNLRSGTIAVSESTRTVSAKVLRNHFSDFDRSTVFISINGTLGNAAIYGGEKIMLGKSAAYIKCTGTIDPQFVYFVITTIPYIRYYHREASGTTIYNLSLATLRGLPIPLPTHPEQIEILQHCDKIIRDYTKASKTAVKQIENLKKYLATLIAHAVTGRLKVQ